MERVWSESDQSVVVTKTIREQNVGDDDDDDDEAERTTTASQLSERAIAFSIDSLLRDLPRSVSTATGSGKYESFIFRPTQSQKSNPLKLFCDIFTHDERV